MTKRTLDKQYERYVMEYKELRKARLVKMHERKLTRKQFEDLAEIHNSASKARKEALRYQNKVGDLSKSDINKMWKTYHKQGGVKSMNELGGKKSKAIDRKFRTKETMIKNLKANQLIQLMIDSGLTQDEALEAYGY